MPIVFPISVGGGGLSFTDLSGGAALTVFNNPNIVAPIIAQPINIAVLLGASYAVFRIRGGNNIVPASRTLVQWTSGTGLAFQQSSFYIGTDALLPFDMLWFADVSGTQTYNLTVLNGVFDVNLLIELVGYFS